MVTVEELINSSLCFGQAYDPSVKECKVCEVRLKCKAKCEGCTGSGEIKSETLIDKKPETVDVAEKSEVTFNEEELGKKPEKKAKKPVKPNNKKVVEYAEDMPDLKAMELEALVDLAKERGVDLAEFDKYSNKSIKRMRITMAIKKTYEK